MAKVVLTEKQKLEDMEKQVCKRCRGAIGANDLRISDIADISGLTQPTIYRQLHGQTALKVNLVMAIEYLSGEKIL